MKNIFKQTRGKAQSSKLLVDYHIDSPTSKYINTDTIHVEGWIVPLDSTNNLKIKVSLNDQEWMVGIDKLRPDVAGAFNKTADIPFGFNIDIPREDGMLRVECASQKGVSCELYNSEVVFSPEDLVDMIKNTNLAEYNAEQEIFLSNLKTYHYEDNSNKHYLRHKDDPRIISFYLPQFHPFEENDKAWGKGFTEWTNVTSAKPRFVGHVQPLLPDGLGFYDLRVPETIKDQFDLAKQHGVYGFCFYYYWFSGKKVMDKPLNTVLEHKEWDFNFSICWANENWTKRWDGRDDDVILAQKYRQDDPLRFIEDVAPILNDPRYINEEGKPVLLVYRASELKNPEYYAEVWRSYFKEHYGKDLYLVASMGFEAVDPKSFGFDIGLDFAPQTTFFKGSCFNGGSFPYVKEGIKVIDNRFSGSIASYREVALNKTIHRFFDFPTIPSVAPSWDNDARRKGKGFVMNGANPDLFGKWLENVLLSKKSVTSPLVFINAWNEWAEGAILEPSDRFGYANLNRLTQILSRFGVNEINRRNFPVYGIAVGKAHKKALFLHISPQDDTSEFINILDSSKNYDIYLTATMKHQSLLNELGDGLMKKIKAIDIVPNRGGDILPFSITTRRYNLLSYASVTKIDLSHDITPTDIKHDRAINISDVNGSVIFSNPKVQLAEIQWLDVHDFPGAR